MLQLNFTIVLIFSCTAREGSCPMAQVRVWRTEVGCMRCMAGAS